MARRRVLWMPVLSSYQYFATRGDEDVIYWWRAKVEVEEGFVYVNFLTRVRCGYEWVPDEVVGKVPADMLEALAESPVPGVLRMRYPVAAPHLVRLAPGDIPEGAGEGLKRPTRASGTPSSRGKQHQGKLF